jgi:hypothetical protein
VQTTTEVSLVQDDHVVEELAADGADHARGEGVLPAASSHLSLLQDLEI